MKLRPHHFMLTALVGIMPAANIKPVKQVAKHAIAKVDQLQSGLNPIQKGAEDVSVVVALAALVQVAIHKNRRHNDFGIHG